MVLLTTTPQILSAIALLPSSSSASASTRLLLPPGEDESSSSSSSSPLPTTLETPISHQTLISLSRALQSSQQQIAGRSAPSDQRSHYTLNSLLQNTRPYYPPPPSPPQPSAEYLALKARLVREREQREYDALVSTTRRRGGGPLTSITTADKNEPWASDADEDDISPSLVLNITLSVLLSAFAVFYATRHWSNDGVRVLLSLGAGIVVGVAETVVYAAYLRKVARARERETRRRERKVVVVCDDEMGGERKKEVEKDMVGGGGGEAKTGGDEEEIQIWGRGLNGGVRRRVRERWEKEESEREMQGGI